ncbi:hypothetical protein TNCV_597241 [Trichonephila clavipes]|nr:hypothetical protein TNCV_597241 [Trichonephila clavipes]
MITLFAGSEYLTAKDCYYKPFSNFKQKKLFKMVCLIQLHIREEKRSDNIWMRTGGAHPLQNLIDSNASQRGDGCQPINLQGDEVRKLNVSAKTRIQRFYCLTVLISVHMFSIKMLVCCCLNNE